MMHRTLSLLAALALGMVSATAVRATGADDPAQGFESPSTPARGVELFRLLRKDENWHNLAFKAALDDARRDGVDLNGLRDDQGRTLLLLAAERGWMNEGALLLLAGLDPNARTASDGRTALHHVVRVSREDTNCLRDMLALRGADVNAADREGTTPLMIAAERGNVSAIEFLVWMGAQVHPQSVPADHQPVELARRAGHPDAVAVLEPAGQGVVPTYRGKSRDVPAYIQRSFARAARLGDFQRLQGLLLAGAQLDEPDDEGFTPLVRAIQNQQVDVITYLLIMGANPNRPERDGRPPLMATHGWFGMTADYMRLMLAVGGADPHLVNRFGNSVLTQACERNNEHAAQLAIFLGADPRAAAPAGSPMRVASRAGNQDVVNLLRRNGVTEAPYAPEDPKTRFFFAVKRGDADGVLRALAEGVPVDTTDENGNHAVVMAIHARQLNTARLLLKNGSAVNFQNPKTGNTALTATTSWLYPDNEKFREELLAAGADPNLPNKDGITPFITACGYGDLNPKIPQMLAHGAELNRRDNQGHTPLWHSRQNGRTDATRYLLGLGAVE